MVLWTRRMPCSGAPRSHLLLARGGQLEPLAVRQEDPTRDQRRRRHRHAKPAGPAPGHRATRVRLLQQRVGASSDKAWAFDANLWEVLCHSGLPTDRDEL